MKTKSKYDGNSLGLPPAFLSFCEALGEAVVKASQERQKRLREAQIVDTDYEEVKPNLLPQDTSNDGTINNKV